MEHAASTWREAIRLAVGLSVLATVAAVMLAALGDVPQSVIVLSVIVVGFVASWVRTGHLAQRSAPAHRAIRVPVRHTHPVG